MSTTPTNEVTPDAIVETSTVKKMYEAFEYAGRFYSMVSITGPTGRGKTFTARHWAKTHPQAHYIRVPSGGGRRQIVSMLCDSCGIGTNGSCANLELRLFKAFTPRNVIIVDEAGHLVHKTNSNGTSAIELLRDLHDICGCSVVMIFTDVYLKAMAAGRMFDYFEQFRGRIKFKVDIPSKIFRSEVEDVVKFFNPAPQQRLVELAYKTAGARDGKLRTLFEDLQRAKEWADRENRPMQFQDLALAVDWRKSGGVWPEE